MKPHLRYSPSSLYYCSKYNELDDIDSGIGEAHCYIEKSIIIEPFYPGISGYNNRSPTPEYVCALLRQNEADIAKYKIELRKNSDFITSDFVKLNNLLVDAIRHHMTSIQDRIKVLKEQVRQFGSCPISNCKIHNPINFANAEGTNHVNVK
ncbi:hypothetical protein CEXT_629971 [Caerostris extrusa]|uniref:Uncharacterized protein n=1 Tax=Caerostris extrusa TaxID=172846 RepID=A0AAV4NV75_CAEEX|nr:hypothetical protein CEXT_629971 [Caerostris extrusa]